MNSELDVEYEKYKDIIDKSRFKDQIIFLKEHPELAYAHLHDRIQPCCWGTVVYLVGENRKIRRLWVEKGHRLDDYSDALGDFVCIPNDNAPGYVGEQPMELFQTGLVRRDLEPDMIISFYWDNPSTELCGFRLRHSALYLGKHDDGIIIFHQSEEGGRFSIHSVEQFKESLSPHARETLESRFYTP